MHGGFLLLAIAVPRLIGKIGNIILPGIGWNIITGAVSVQRLLRQQNFIICLREL